MPVVVAFAGSTIWAADGVPLADDAGHAPAITLDLPAVEKLNGKVEYFGGWMNSDEGHNFAGSVSLPAGEHFGVQGDALYTHVIGRSITTDFFAGGAHFFWRNPGRAMVGFFAGGESGEVQYTVHAGVEGEYYLNRLTLGLSVGIGHLKYDQPVSFFDTDQTRFVGSVFAAWYPTDQLMCQLGYANLFENHLGQTTIEYQTPVRGLSLTADAGIGSHNYDYILLGVRYYFGRNKSLIERHRQDDPGGLLRRVMNGLGLVGADYNEKAVSQGRDNSGGFGEIDQQWTPPEIPPPVVPGNSGFTAIEISRAVQQQNGNNGLLPPLPPTSFTAPDDLNRIIVPVPPGG